MHHKGEDTHLRGATVVEFDGALRELLLLGPPHGVHVIVAVRLDRLLHASETELQQTDEKENLQGTGGRDIIESRETGLHRGEGHAIGDVTCDAPASGSSEVPEDGEHGDAAVLDLRGAQAI